MNLKQATIGTDPETLLFNRKTNEFCSAIDLIPEGKECENPPRDLGNGYKVLHDNVLLEFNIPPSETKGDFINNLKEGFNRIYKIIGNNYDIAPIASHNFADKYLKSDEAKRFGCAPEFCAYEVSVCEPPEPPKNFRSAGAHIHIGRKDYKNYIEIDDMGNAFPKEDIKEGETLIDPYSKLNVIKLMDIFVGLPLTFIDTAAESKARKKLYGMAGRHRPTNFGVEYRMPSNYWISSPELTTLVYDLSLIALQHEIERKAEKFFKQFPDKAIRSILDSGNNNKAKNLIKNLGLPKSILETLNKFSTNLVSPLELRKNWELK